jgi:hypothetical protein
MIASPEWTQNKKPTDQQTVRQALTTETLARHGSTFFIVQKRCRWDGKGIDTMFAIVYLLLTTDHDGRY